MPCIDESVFMKLMLGELPPATRAEVESHLDACPTCRRMVAGALRAQTPDGPPGEQTRLSSRSLLRRAPEEPPLEKGTAVGRYRVLERLGAGGMGIVYSAHDPELDRRVALKLLRARSLGLEADDARGRLLHEAQAMARVSHPHVVPVYDVGTFRGQVFLAMELVEAQTLRTWLKAGPRPWRQVLAHFLDAGQGLAAAHAAGVVHGDFKPENVLLGRDGRVRVTDFGLARLATADEDTPPSIPGAAFALPSEVETRTTTGGTPAYMAPEQLCDGVPADARSDQFSFCVALYEALHGERPFLGRTIRELSQALRSGQPRPVPRRTPVPPWLRRVLLRGLALRPSERFPSMEALLDVLRRDPDARRRRGLSLGAAGLGVAAGAVLLTHAFLTRSAAACQGAERELAGIWDAARREAIQSAFQATHKPFAQAAWQRVERELSAYTAAWVTARTTTCEATHVRREQPEPVLALRMGCLDGRLAEMAALTHLFTRADADMVEQAPRAVARLRPLTGCTDGASLQAGAIPTDPAARARVEALGRTLVEARARQAAGRYKEALALVAPAAEAAKAAGDRHASASAFLLLGQLAEREGDWLGAEAALAEAVRAGEASRNDEASAGAWVLRVRVAGLRLERHELVGHWKELAEAALERLGGDTDALRSELRTHWGEVMDAQGRFGEAAEQKQAALALVEKRFGPDSLEAADVLTRLGVSRTNQGRVDEGLAHLRRAEGLFVQALGEQHPEVGHTRLQLAQTHWHLGDLKEAERLSRVALELLERVHGPEHPAVGSALNALGTTLQYQGRLDEALPLLERALAITVKANGPDSTSAATVGQNLASVRYQLGHVDEALKAMQAVRASMEKRHGAGHSHMVMVLRQIGRMLLGAQRPEECIPYFERAAELQLSLPDDTRSQWTQTLNDLGYAYLSAKRPKEALAPLERALAGWEKARPTDDERAETRHSLAIALWESGQDKPRAVKLATEALAIADGATPPLQARRTRLEKWFNKRELPVPPPRPPPVSKRQAP
jgi:tetratricopeptide (TPR) repeat protein